MCRHFREDYGVVTRVARFHNVYGPNGTWDGGREKAPAALCRKVITAKDTGSDEIELHGFVAKLLRNLLRVLTHCRGEATSSRNGRDHIATVADMATWTCMICLDVVSSKY